MSFLRMVNFYHRFVPHAAALMGPLHGMSQVKGWDFQWTAQLQSAFDATKQALASATLIVHPSATASTCLTVDTSDLAVGSVLEQFLEGNWKPLAFFSRKLDKAQKAYSTFDRELLAMYSAVKHFTYFIEGQRFHIYRSQAPYIRFCQQLGMLDSKTTPPRFHSRIHNGCANVHGRGNAVADALSRVELSEDPVCMAAGSLDLDLLRMAQAQLTDAGVQAFRTAITSMVFADLLIPGTNTWRSTAGSPYVAARCL